MFIMIIIIIIVVIVTTTLIGFFISCLNLFLQRSNMEIKRLMDFDHICNRPYDTDLLAYYLSTKSRTITLKRAGISFSLQELRNISDHRRKMSIIAKYVRRNNPELFSYIPGSTINTSLLINQIAQLKKDVPIIYR